MEHIPFDKVLFTCFCVLYRESFLGKSHKFIPTVEFFGNRSKGLILFNVNHSIKVLFFFFLLVPNHNRSISTYIIILSGSILVKLAQLLGNTIHFSDLLICRFCQ